MTEPEGGSRRPASGPDGDGGPDDTIGGPDAVTGGLAQMFGEDDGPAPAVPVATPVVATSDSDPSPPLDVTAIFGDDTGVTPAVPVASDPPAASTAPVVAMFERPEPEPDGARVESVAPPDPVTTTERPGTVSAPDRAVPLRQAAAAKALAAAEARATDVATRAEAPLLATGGDASVGSAVTADDVASTVDSEEPSPGVVVTDTADATDEDGAGDAPAQTGDRPTSSTSGAVSPLAQIRQVRPPRSRWWSIGFPVIITLVVLAIPALLWMGKETILDSTDGQVTATVNDPLAPGYEALVEPTETLLVLDENADGSLSSATVLALTGPTSGGLVSIPPDTVMVTPEGPPVALAAAYDEGGVAAVQPLIEAQLDAAMTETKVVSAAEWADLVAPVAPLTVDNPDVVTVVEADGNRRIAFPAGEVELGAEDVASYLSTRNPGESDLNRMVRQQRLWAAWLHAVAEAGDDPAVVPGEVDSGLGRFIRTLAAAQVELQTLPVQRVPLPGSEASVFDPLEDQITPLVGRLVPFPVGAPPGARLRVRVLDGTGRLQQGLPAAAALVVGGGEIAVVGNAATFDHTTTQIIYLDEAQRPAAEALRDALGLGELVKGTEATDVVDVTVILGADAEGTLGGTAMTTSTLSPVTVTEAEK